MQRVIGMDIHRNFGEAAFREQGKLRHGGRVDMTPTALEGYGKRLLATDEVVIEATGNCMAVRRVRSPFVKQVVIANPLQVKAIAHAHVKTDKVDAGTLARLHAAGYLLVIWTPDAATERMRRLVARRYQVVRHRTRIKNEVHPILHAHLIPKCPHADLFNGRGRAWHALHFTAFFSATTSAGCRMWRARSKEGSSGPVRSGTFASTLPRSRSTGQALHVRGHRPHEQIRLCRIARTYDQASSREFPAPARVASGSRQRVSAIHDFRVRGRTSTGPKTRTNPVKEAIHNPAAMCSKPGVPGQNP